MSSGRGILHDSGAGHVKGESVFIDDRQKLQNELHVGVVGSPVSAGKVKRIDFADALRIPGVVGVFTHRDFRRNRWGTVVHDQPLLIVDEIGYIDEPVCLIAAESRQALKDARKRVKIEVEERKPIYSIDEAMAQKSILYRSKGLRRGDADKAISGAPHRLSGVFEIGGQEHFYLESQASIAYPLENGQLEIHSSSQHPTEVQHVCAEVLGLRHHQVVCIVKRMGGAFGGKESQAAPFAAMAALVASRLKRPARLVLDVDDDMRMTGKRHPFKNSYEVGFDDEGRILGLRAELLANGGAYTDLSASVLERAVFHIDGSYYLENVAVEAAVCKTHMHSNTAFRGFGGPQGNMTMEAILEEIAIFLKKDSYEVRRINLYGRGDRNVTPYGQIVENNVLPELFSRLHKTSGYAERSEKIRESNRAGSGPLRGLALTAVKFGIAFNARFLNQANALVNVHRDGTVQVSTGATEMGQGVNTKIRQVVADTFAISSDRVQVMPTSTEKNHNTSPTAASSGADLNTAAALVACGKIKSRLLWVAHCLFTPLNGPEGFPRQLPEVDLGSLEFAGGKIVDSSSGKSVSWEEVVNKAYLNRFALGEYGYFRTEGLDFDEASRRGRAFKYFTQGAAVSEVEIDEYTGELKVRQVDILMDMGIPLNPGIDRGQVIGGFVQGMGWVTTESLEYDSRGRLSSHSPTTYKVPNIQDTPRVFQVEFFENSGNHENVYRSKAGGEPPLLLSASVLMAVKNALSFRAPGIPSLRSPVTAEEILMELSKYGPV